MKQRFLPLLALVLALLLSACTQPSPPQTPGFTPTVAEQLLGCGAFSEPIDALEPDIAWGLYRLSAAGLSREQMTDAIAFRSSGATCEELALLTFSDENAAQTAKNALTEYIDDQILANKDYRPAQLPKLEQARLICRGTTVLLLIANDYAPAQPLLDR